MPFKTTPWSQKSIELSILYKFSKLSVFSYIHSYKSCLDELRAMGPTRINLLVNTLLGPRIWFCSINFTNNVGILRLGIIFLKIWKNVSVAPMLLVEGLVLCYTTMYRPKRFADGGMAKLKPRFGPFFA